MQSALFENNIFLVAQHMMQYAVTGKPAAPMPNRMSAWAVYDVFEVKDSEQIFLAVVSDTQWEIYCRAFGFADLKADPRLASNNDRVRAREWIMPELRKRMAPHSASELGRMFEQHGLPYAPITKPQDLFDDPHLIATGGLTDITLTDGRATRTPLLPLTMDGKRLPLRHDPPRLGQHSEELLRLAGYTDGEVASLIADGIVGIAPAGPAPQAA